MESLFLFVILLWVISITLTLWKQSELLEEIVALLSAKKSPGKSPEDSSTEPARKEPVQ